MGNNTISAIVNIANFGSNDLKDYSTNYLSRVNAVGEQLEFYVKDSLAGAFTKPLAQKIVEYHNTFSYGGTQNHPPDMMLRDGDAFEIKKIQGNPKASLALNSSPPKDMLHSTDPRITEECRNCEKWAKKDLFYVVGYTKSSKIKYLFFVHGMCYAADKATYENIHAPLKKSISNIIKSRGLKQDTQTVELGKVRIVDPLGRTELRIRGMWQIQNPLKAFESIYSFDERKKFSLAAIMKKEKYNSFPQKDIKVLEGCKNISVKDVKIPDPNNNIKLMDAKLITLE